MINSSRGFTLIEVLIVIAIVAILAAIAVPGYQSYMLKSRRVDAHGLLQAAQIAQEKFRLNNTTYAGSADLVVTNPALGRVCVWVGTACRSQAQHYYLEFSNNTATGYTLTARPVVGGVQTRDTLCPSISISQAAGVVTYSPDECWRR